MWKSTIFITVSDCLFYIDNLMRTLPWFQIWIIIFNPKWSLHYTNHEHNILFSEGSIEEEYENLILIGKKLSPCERRVAHSRPPSSARARWRVPPSRFHNSTSNLSLQIKTSDSKKIILLLHQRLEKIKRELKEDEDFSHTFLWITLCSVRHRLDRNARQDGRRRSLRRIKRSAAVSSVQ